MSTFRNPVGPQPSTVYWRRRLIVGLGLLAVIIIIVLIVVRPGSGAPTPSDSKTPPSSSSDTPASGSTNPADAVACDPAKVTVEATTDATNYDAGVNPVLSFTLKSLMTVPCTLAADTDLQEFTITSGDERIWDSKDCQTDKTPATALLQPGVPFAGSKITWDRTRSATDTCDAARDQVTAEGASYHLDVKIGDLTSANSKQFLLN